MDEIFDAAAPAEAQDAPSAAPPPDDDAAGETAHQEAPAAAAPSALESTLAHWHAHWYPDPAPIGHPAPPFSGAAHHARAAFEDLVQRLRG